MRLSPEECELVLSGADQYAECVGGYRESEERLLNYIESLIAAGIAHERARCAWQPIESAPKDGTAILLGNQDGSWIAYWLPEYPSGYRPPNPWFSLMLNRDYMGRRYAPPTHWMPLPQPPQEAPADGGQLGESK